MSAPRVECQQRSMGGRRPREAKSVDEKGDDENVSMLLDCFKRGMIYHKTPPRSAQKEKIQNKDSFSIATTSYGRSSEIVQSSLSISLNKSDDETSKLQQQAANFSVLKASKTPTDRRQQNHGKQISPGVFYGSPAGKPSKKPPQLLRLLHEIHKDLTEENDLRLRTVVWATFPRQEQALQFAESHSKVHVFSYQDHLNGKRRFLATTYEEFWRRYEAMDPKYRHHYEVIQEGSPCHLYFDLEYNCTANLNADGVAMVDLLLSVISDAMLDIYSFNFETDWTVELDSSTTEKFSRHLVVHMPNAAFKDNSHVGAFVGEICARIANLREVDAKFNQLYVLKNNSLSQICSELFVDSAVYSRNRCFRLPLSSKAGKNSFLLPTGRFRCKNMSECQMFMESLICKMDKCEKLLTFDAKAVGNGGGVTDIILAAYPVRHPKTITHSCTSGRSPFPAVDAFVESVSSVGNIPGSIRSWYWFSEHGVIVYNINGNRFCENIGRQHKSNHVMYIVDFRSASYYQKCHDPDCRGFRSPLRPIPEETICWTFPVPEVLQIKNNGEENRLKMCLTKDVLEDETWWQEVVSTVEDVENKRRHLESSQQECTSNCNDDDDWWIAVEEEASQLEKRIA
ncbi:uncharacterized protein LOC131077968 isoform X2 [Cryptomeria japonica]|uniref:uncharacterized protein LOC131077968 isoform X2 n=1 Tax=Cryptomeria japonica TaxID=3369 RepID=UPI0027DA7B43|nr:uncharacterized protein LOC131077968 isoform X2 [Cryptomeria japonica]